MKNIPPQILAMNANEKVAVEYLGDQIGYGRLMQLAEQIWHDKAIEGGMPGGEHTQGPCAFFMVKCPHTFKDAMDHCDICCGSGRITKWVHDNLATLSPATAKGGEDAPMVLPNCDYLGRGYDGDPVYRPRETPPAPDAEGIEAMLAEYKDRASVELKWEDGEAWRAEISFPPTKKPKNNNWTTYVGEGPTPAAAIRAAISAMKEGRT